MRHHVLDFKSKEDENCKVDEPGLKKRKLGIDFEESDDEDNDQVDSLKRERDSYRSEPLGLEWTRIVIHLTGGRKESRSVLIWCA